MKFNNDINDVATETFICEFEPVTHYQWVVAVRRPAEEPHLILQLSLYDNDLLRRDFAAAPPIATDLIELAAAVYAVDRAIQPDEMAYCIVQVLMPVRCPDLLSQQEVHDKLSDILYWYTSYEWHFNFTQREENTRTSESPHELNPRSVPLKVRG